MIFDMEGHPGTMENTGGDPSMVRLCLGGYEELALQLSGLTVRQQLRRLDGMLIAW
jgi:hypothetical protein